MKNLSLRNRLLALLPFFLLFVSTTSSAQLAGWSYVQPITIKENTGNNQYHYQVRMVINTAQFVSASQMSANGADIRFGKDASGSVLYNYWIEANMNATNTIIWVNVDTLLGHQCTTIYMFYGNGSVAAVSDINHCFDGPFSATDSLSGGSHTNPSTSDVETGFTFSVNTNMVITQFGKYNYQATNPVRLYNDQARSLIQEVTVTGGSQNAYAPVAWNVWLSPGTTYCLTIVTATYSAYYYTSSPTINSHLNFGQNRYGGNITYPTGVGASTFKGYPDFLFYAYQKASPEPTVTLANNALALHPASNVTECFGHTLVIGDTVSGAGGPVAYNWNPTTGISDAHVAQPTLNTATAQTYTETATDSSTGCVVTANINVTVAHATTATVNDTVCQGGSYTVNGHTYTATGTFVDTLAFASGAGCDSIVTLNLTVHPKPTPSIYQTGDSLYTGFYNSYQWLFLGTPVSNSNVQTIYAAHNGDYRVLVTDANGCSDTSVVFNYVKTGISTSPTDVELTVYPNPNQGSFAISIPSSLIGKELSITDYLGRKLVSHTTAKQTENIDMADMPAGVYVVTIGGRSVRFVVRK